MTSSAQVERTDKIKNHVLSGLAAGGVLTFPNLTGEVTDVRISVPSQLMAIRLVNYLRLSLKCSYPGHNPN